MNKDIEMNINFERLTQFRRKLHQNPELSGHESWTAKQLVEELKKCEPDQIWTHVGGHGVVAAFDSGFDGPKVMLRADMDALPIQEVNTFEYRSKFQNVSHKCGHDGHSTILLGVAQFLQQQPPKKGKVLLLFQPAEENGEGARAVIEDEKWQEMQPDYVFALHNLPGFPLGQIVVKPNTFTASVNSLIIHLKGKTSHAAEPEHGLNPALALAKIIEQVLKLANNDAEDEAMRVITVVHIHLGELAYGISAGQGSLHLTLRCWNDEHLEKLEKDIRETAKKNALEERLEVSFEETQRFHANQNDAEAVTWVRKAAQAANLDLLDKKMPFKWGEDFGLFTAKYPGCMFGLGGGESLPALHNPDYDFPDEITPSGVQIFTQIINQILN